MRRQFLTWMCVALAGLSGCAAYHLGPTNGETAGGHSIQINGFVNKTLQPRLSDYVIASLRKKLQQDATYRLATHNDGDIIVTGVITAYDRSELSYQPTDVVTVQDYRIALTAEITAKERSTGRVLVHDSVTGHTSLRAGKDLTSAERQAIPLLADDLARRAASLLVDGSW